MGSSKEVTLAAFVMLIILCSSSAQNIKNDGTTLLLTNLIDAIDNLSLQLQDVNGKLADIEESQKTMEADIKQQQEKINSLKKCSKMDQMSDLQEILATRQQRLESSLSEFQDLLATDECEQGKNNCSNVAKCTDSAVHYKCTCLPGYSGDGFTCEDVDECTLEMFKCDANEMCSNTPGNYTCICQEGYRKEGDTCQDVDECRENITICAGANEVCKNNLGSYACTCRKNFKREGDICQGPFCESPSLNIPSFGCVRLIEEKMNWGAAKSRCQEMGMRLVEDLQKDDLEPLLQHLVPVPGDWSWSWVGARDGRWLTSGKEVSQDTWRTGQPDEGNQDCEYVRLHPSDSGVGDEKCSNSNYYTLCQFLP